MTQSLLTADFKRLPLKTETWLCKNIPMTKKQAYNRKWNSCPWFWFISVKREFLRLPSKSPSSNHTQSRRILFYAATKLPVRLRREIAESILHSKTTFVSTAFRTFWWRSFLAIQGIKLRITFLAARQKTVSTVFLRFPVRSDKDDMYKNSGV